MHAALRRARRVRPPRPARHRRSPRCRLRRRPPPRCHSARSRPQRRRSRKAPGLRSEAARPRRLRPAKPPRKRRGSCRGRLRPQLRPLRLGAGGVRRKLAVPRRPVRRPPGHFRASRLTSSRRVGRRRSLPSRSSAMRPRLRTVRRVGPREGSRRTQGRVRRPPAAWLLGSASISVRRSRSGRSGVLSLLLFRLTPRRPNDSAYADSRDTPPRRPGPGTPRRLPWRIRRCRTWRCGRPGPTTTRAWRSR